MQAGGKAGKAGYSYAQIRSAVEDIIKQHVDARKAAGRTTTYSGLRSAGREILQQWEKVNITLCNAAVLCCYSCAVCITCIPASAALVGKLTSVVLQMTDENPDLNIGFRFVHVPNLDTVRRRQVRWRLAMHWKDSPMAQGPQVVSASSLDLHLQAAVPQHLIPPRLHVVTGQRCNCKRLTSLQTGIMV